MANESSVDIYVGLIKEYVMPYVYTINLSFGCGVCSLFGIITNIMNIMIFVRQGFQETINISLLGLAVSDMCSLIALLWVSICYNPLFMYSGLPILTRDLQHISGGWTHVIFTRITGFITVFITFGRCLCIAFPLQVKTILTPRCVSITIVSIYLVVIGTMAPIYGITEIGWKFVLKRNRTMLKIIYVMDYPVAGLIKKGMFYVQLLYPLISFVAVIACSSVLISKLNERSLWRQSASTGTTENRSFARDRQVVKLVVVVAAVFIVSSTPSLALFAVMFAVPGVNMGQENENLLILLYSISFPMEAINSSVNIFIYYKTSSKYKKYFESMFPFGARALRRQKN